MPNDAAPACSVAFSGAARTPRVEKKLAKSTVGPAMPALAAAYPLDLGDLLAGPFGGVRRSCPPASIPPAKEVRLLKFASPMRW